MCEHKHWFGYVVMSCTRALARSAIRQLHSTVVMEHPATKVHASAAKGFTAASASLYNTGRPTYTAESLQRVLEVLFSSKTENSAATVLELGAGTGKFSTIFLDFTKEQSNIEAYPVLKNLKYIATEPSEGFRDNLAQSLKGSNVEVKYALGTEIPACDNSLDGVIAAQAFHWMATTDTLKEVHRVLLPYSPLIMIWNSYDYSYDWLRQLDIQVLSKAYKPDVPRQQNGRWEHCFSTMTGTSLFSMVHKWQGRNIHVGDEQMVVNRYMSTSVIAEKDEAERAEIERTVRHILATHPELAEARRTGRFEVPYITELAWANSNLLTL